MRKRTICFRQQSAKTANCAGKSEQVRYIVYMYFFPFSDLAYCSNSLRSQNCEEEIIAHKSTRFPGTRMSMWLLDPIVIIVLVIITTELSTKWTIVAALASNHDFLVK